MSEFQPRLRNNTVVTPGRFSQIGDTVSSNKVLRNTYLLLSMTLLWSAALAAGSMALNLPPLPWFLNLAGMFGLLFLVNATKNSSAGIFSVFAFTGFTGFMLGPMLSAYLKFVPNGGELVALSLGGTGVIFLGLSSYALVSKKDFSYMGGFLLAGLLIVIVASIANIFLHISGLSLAISAVAIGLFSAMILFDTSRIIHGGETNYLMATISLYLDFYNLFIHLLSFTGMMSRDR